MTSTYHNPEYRALAVRTHTSNVAIVMFWSFFPDALFDSSPVGPLTRRSYELHELHSTMFKDTYYRTMDTWSVSVHPPGAPKDLATQNLTWLNSRSVSGLSHLASESLTAQVHPRLYTEALAAECFRQGALLIQAEALQVSLENDDYHLAVLLANGTNSVIKSDVLVICMGSWSDTLLQPVLGRQVMGAIKATSVVLTPKAPVPNVALFSDWLTPGEDSNYDPEVYPRSDGTVYICARAEPIEVPPADGPQAVLPEPEVTDRMLAYAAQLTPLLSEVPVVATQACLLPTTLDDRPIIGLLQAPALFVATGHSCWGILNAPATGESLAQLIHEGKSDLDLSGFDPRRFLDE